jgi:hypothetical protein
MCAGNLSAVSVTMDNLRKVSWNWTGEEQRSLEGGDKAPFADIAKQTLQQAARALVNEIESSLWVAAFKGGTQARGQDKDERKGGFLGFLGLYICKNPEYRKLKERRWMIHSQRYSIAQSAILIGPR